MRRRESPADTGALSTAVVDAIGSDALDAPSRRSGDTAGSTTGCVVFSYNGCEAHVASEGDVRISGPDDR